MEDVQIESRVVKGEAKELNKLETTSHCNLIYSQTESPEDTALTALWSFSNFQDQNRRNTFQFVLNSAEQRDQLS